MIADIPEIRWATTVDGASIAYQDFGSGPVTLVLIPGWVSHLETRMDDVRAVVDAAGAEHAALLGWGWVGPWSIHAPAASLRATGWDHEHRALAVTDRSEHELKGVPGSRRLYAAEPVA